jgi:hypothetical protein
MWYAATLPVDSQSACRCAKVIPVPVCFDPSTIYLQRDSAASSRTPVIPSSWPFVQGCYNPSVSAQPRWRSCKPWKTQHGTGDAVKLVDYACSTVWMCASCHQIQQRQTSILARQHIWNDRCAQYMWRRRPRCCRPRTVPDFDTTQSFIFRPARHSGFITSARSEGVNSMSQSTFQSCT